MGTKAAIFLPFLISCTRAHLRMAELGCLASMPLRVGEGGVKVGEGGEGAGSLLAAAARMRPCPTPHCMHASAHACVCEVHGARASTPTHIFSSTMPLEWEAPAKGFFHSLPKWALLKSLSAHLRARSVHDTRTFGGVVARARPHSWRAGRLQLGAPCGRAHAGLLLLLSLPD